MQECRICHGLLGPPVYESPLDASVTSLCQILDGKTCVWHCENCSHTQTKPLLAVDNFYAVDYHILTADEKEDQLYSMCDGRKVFRTEHQVTTLLEKVNLSSNARVLDYGSGKGSTLRELCGNHSGIIPFVFDVGEQYRLFWKKFCPEENQAVGQLPPDWDNSMDVVVSFFALEHVSNPRAFVRNVNCLLKPGGVFYFLVPNIFENTADLVVADHLNHFSEGSLHRLLADASFVVRDIDAKAHNSAWVVVAEKSDVKGSVPVTKSVSSQIADMSTYWREFGGRVRDFESDVEGEVAIYGSGFYGALIYVSLNNAQKVSCFLDQNPHRQKQSLLGKPILAPEVLPETVERLYVGLNPRVAQAELVAVNLPELEIFFP